MTLYKEYSSNESKYNNTTDIFVIVMDIKKIGTSKEKYEFWPEKSE